MPLQVPPFTDFVLAGLFLRNGGRKCAASYSAFDLLSANGTVSVTTGIKDSVL